MQHVIMAIRDSAVGAYQTPFTSPSIGAAIRSFQDAINNPQSGTLHGHPDDYELYHIGIFDDETAKITECEEPTMRARAKDLVRKT